MVATLMVLSMIFGEFALPFRMTTGLFSDTSIPFRSTLNSAGGRCTEEVGNKGTARSETQLEFAADEASLRSEGRRDERSVDIPSGYPRRIVALQPPRPSSEPRDVYPRLSANASGICRPWFPYARSRTAFPQIAVQLLSYRGTTDTATEGAGEPTTVTTGVKKANTNVFRWVEIGSRQCLNTEQMLTILRLVVPFGWAIETYAVDSWGYRGPEAVFDNNDERSGRENYAECQTAIGHLPGVHLLKNLSTNAARLFDDEFFDFVYIDALHTYDACVADMAAWYPKAKPGALFAGDDFGDAMLPAVANAFNVALIGRVFRWGVIRAVTEFAIDRGVNYHITAYETQYDNRFGKRPRPVQAAPNWYLVKPHPKWHAATCEQVRWPGDVLMGPDGNTTKSFVDEQVEMVVAQFQRQHKSTRKR